MPRIVTDHYASRMRIAERAEKLAAKIHRLTVQAERLRIDAEAGERAEMLAADGNGYSGGWSLLKSGYSVDSLDRAACQLRSAARNAGYAPTVTL